MRTALLISVFLVAASALAAENPYGDMPTVATDGLRMTLRVKGKTFDFARPLAPTLDETKFKAAQWVDGSARAGGDGARETPFNDLQKALDQLKPGTLLRIRGGTYAGAFAMSKSGTADAPIGLAPAPGETVRIVLGYGIPRKNKHAGAFVLSGCKHVIVHGLLFEGSLGRDDEPENEYYGSSGVTLVGKAGEGCVLSGNISYNNTHCGLKEQGHGGTDFTMIGNVCFNNGQTAHDHGVYLPSSNARLIGNVLFANKGWGVHAYSSPTKNVIERNVCWDNGSGGIIVAGAENVIRRNTCVEKSIPLMLFRSGAKRNVIENNVFAGAPRYQIVVDNCGGQDALPSDNQLDYNGYWLGVSIGEVVAWMTPDPKVIIRLDEKYKAPPVWDGGHSLFADPVFLAPDRHDYRLSDKSPLRRVGKPDAQGNRPDLGAFSSESSGTQQSKGM